MRFNVLLPILLISSAHAKMLSPTAEAFFQQAHEQQKAGLFDKAIRSYSQVLSLAPDHLESHKAIADSYKKNEQFTEAIFHYRTILESEKSNINALFNLACAYLSIGKFDDAIDTFQTLLRLQPHSMSIKYNLGYTLKTAGRIDEAIPIYQELINQNPQYESAQLALGFAYITKGDFKNGWQQHQWYLKKYKKNGEPLRKLLCDNTIQGKTVVLLPEGGLGDTLQFVRYAERLQKMGAKVIGCVQKSLARLLSNCPFFDQIIPTPSPVQVNYDAKVTFMSLPAIFNDTADTFPKNIPYIFPDQELGEYWKKQLSDDHNFKIGICWGASVANDESRLPIARRSVPLKTFYPLRNIPGISLYSLQKYDGINELENLSSDLKITVFDNLDKTSGSFMDTAAIIQEMDLVIAVDSAVAHLAGALGKPVWLLLPLSTDWRWIAGRTDSPWYPTMKIFKQENPFDWAAVIQKIYLELINVLSL